MGAARTLYAALIEAGEIGMTQREAADQLNLGGQTVNTCLTYLVDLGVVSSERESKKGINPNTPGRGAATYRVVYPLIEQFSGAH